MQNFREVKPPPILLEIYHPPKKLFTIGNFPPEAPCIAIVGTREPSPYGREMARWFSEALARHGYTIVSGFARGIDMAAHEGAVSVSGKTIAILGFSLDFPLTHAQEQTKSKILENGGAFISEFPVGTHPSKSTFPQRNRLISGLSIATLIIEAPEKSGALITAAFALEQNRNIFAIPGNIGQKNSVGCHELIKRGEAALVTSPQDIFAALDQQPLPFSMTPPSPHEELPTEEKRIMEIISGGGTGFDELVVKTGYPVPKLQSFLTKLELKNFIYRTGVGFALRMPSISPEIPLQKS